MSSTPNGAPLFFRMETVARRTGRTPKESFAWISKNQPGVLAKLASDHDDGRPIQMIPAEKLEFIVDLMNKDTQKKAAPDLAELLTELLAELKLRRQARP